VSAVKRCSISAAFRKNLQPLFAQKDKIAQASEPSHKRAALFCDAADTRPRSSINGRVRRALREITDRRRRAALAEGNARDAKSYLEA
jgi:hypothetical protein